jgi:hypothetical protein
VSLSTMRPAGGLRAALKSIDSELSKDRAIGRGTIAAKMRATADRGNNHTAEGEWQRRVLY